MKVEEIIKRQNLIIGLVILFIGLIIVRNIYLDQNKKISSLKDEINQLEEKEIILKDIQILEKRIDEYKEKFVKKDVSVLTEELTRYAGICDIKVSSIKPGSEEIYENFTEQPISMELWGNYHRLGRFISLLEKNPQIKIEMIKVSQIDGEREVSKIDIDKERTECLRISLGISLVSFQ